MSHGLVDKSVARLLQKKPVRLQINALTKQGRKELHQVITEFFEKESLNKQHVLAIHYAIVEIVFNAIKANLKFVAFREEIRKQLDRFKISEIEDLLQVIVSERTLREYAARRVMPEVLKDQVQKIFDLEEKYRAGFGQKLSAEQIEFLKRFRSLIRVVDAEVTLQMVNTGDEIRIEVVNSVPILRRDLDRITQSRRRHAELHKAGKAGEFFSYDNMDTTESAGFGIAMVDQGFYKLGLDPLAHLTIEAKNEQTQVKLMYPRSALATR